MALSETITFYRGKAVDNLQQANKFKSLRRFNSDLRRCLKDYI